MGVKKNTARQALYRKYRSKSLSEIIGQDHITKTLANALAQNKLSHAYLFTGPRGTGKTSIARILAHEINKIPYNDESVHLDIIEIDAASNRRIDDIRDLREKVHIAPIAVKYKVYIIDEVHMLTTESFNALLKTLEEPPEHVIFMLATTEVNKLPSTIISRTQRHSLKAIESNLIAKHLRTIADKEAIAISDGALELLAKHGNGSFRDSISLLDQLSSYQDEVSVETVQLLLGIIPTDLLHSLYQTVQSGDTVKILSEINSLVDSGVNPGGIANQLAQIIRDTAAENIITSSDIQLLTNLLTVHSAIYQKLALEAILLEATIKHSTTQPEVHIAKPTPIKASVKQSSPSNTSTTTPKPSVKAPVANDVATEETPLEQDKLPTDTTGDQATNTTTDILEASDPSLNLESNWSKILDVIKSKNNPLYTVMRLAGYSVSGSELILSFEFPFHKKRVDEPKNKAIVSQAVKEVTGNELSIEAIIDKASSVATTGIALPNTSTESAHASVIDSVRDMMGGGEIVNV